MRRFHLVLATLLLLAGAGTAAATELIASPQNAGAPFRHSVFHEASSMGGANGAVLAWLDLDASAVNSYDVLSSVFSATFDLFPDSSLASGTAIGSASAIGSIEAAALSDDAEANAIIGSLDWSIDLGASAGSDLELYLTASFGAQTSDIWNIRFSFADVQYITSAAGRTANTIRDTEISLWGADGVFSSAARLGGTGGFGGFGDTSTLGLDLVVAAADAVQVPEPSTGLLLGAGLAGLAYSGRRRVGFPKTA